VFLTRPRLCRCPSMVTHQTLRSLRYHGSAWCQKGSEFGTRPRILDVNRSTPGRTRTSNPWFRRSIYKPTELWTSLHLSPIPETLSGNWSEAAFHRRQSTFYMYFPTCTTCSRTVSTLGLPRMGCLNIVVFREFFEIVQVCPRTSEKKSLRIRDLVQPLVDTAVNLNSV